VRDFCSKSGTTAGIGVGAILESVLGWRPREEDALARLLGQLQDNGILSRCATILQIMHDPDERNLHEKAAKAIYRQRNGIVHFRHGRSGKEPTIEEFGILCELAWMICKLFTKEIEHQESDSQDHSPFSILDL
jgi:hypothetical protein